MRRCQVLPTPVAGAITVNVPAKPKDTSDGRKITAVASQRRCDIA